MAELIIPITKENKKEVRELYFGNSDKWTVVEESDWVSQGKYDTSFMVVSPIDNPDKFYYFDRSRSGSYWQDYYQEIDDANELILTEVKRIEKIIYSWQDVD